MGKRLPNLHRFLKILRQSISELTGVEEREVGNMGLNQSREIAFAKYGRDFINVPHGPRVQIYIRNDATAELDEALATWNENSQPPTMKGWKKLCQGLRLIQSL